jgi:hypothetical protein
MEAPVVVALVAQVNAEAFEVVFGEGDILQALGAAGEPTVLGHFLDEDERLNRMSLSRLMAGLMSSLLFLLEGRVDEAVRQMEATDTTREPEILVYFARHYSQMGLVDPAIDALRRAARSGFVAPRIPLNETLGWAHCANTRSFRHC